MRVQWERSKQERYNKQYLEQWDRTFASFSRLVVYTPVKFAITASGRGSEEIQITCSEADNLTEIRPRYHGFNSYSALMCIARSRRRRQRGRSGTLLKLTLRFIYILYCVMDCNNITFGIMGWCIADNSFTLVIILVSSLQGAAWIWKDSLLQVQVSEALNFVEFFVVRRSFETGREQPN